MTEGYHDQATVDAGTSESPPSITSGLDRMREHGKSTAPTPKHAKIAIIDDELLNIKIVQKFLQLEGYKNFVATTDSTTALETILTENPDIVLLDIMMPKVDGLEVLGKIRAHEQLEHMPVVILTASDDQETKQRALELGATDFLAKPVDPSDLVPRVRNALMTKAYTQRLEERVRQRTDALVRSRLDVIHSLGRAAEYRDNETGQHVIRVGRYVGVIARGLGLDEAMVELMVHASPLHDVGKIGIPDSILLKPGKLTPEEFETMQRHCQLGRKVFHKPSVCEEREYLTHAAIGAEILSSVGSPILKMAASIAGSHHEKWDGTGYPLALAGEDIPLEGRITAIADVFDALSSKRPYKPAFPREKCFAIMEEGKGKHFDPNILDVFFAHAEEVVKIQIECADLD